jgi:hypothetical protein
MSENEIVQQLKELNERIAKAINELLRVIDEKLKVLSENQVEIIRVLNQPKSIAQAMERKH